MSKVFQIVDGKCHWQTDFSSVEETVGRFPPDCLFVEAPDYVQEGWGFDETLIGEERFLTPEVPEGWFYDRETGETYHESQIPIFLEEAKATKQAENNVMLATYLHEHPMTWQDGKLYGVTVDDQNEIAMNLLSYQMSQAAGVSDAVLEWHSPKEACTPWTVENLTALSLAIRAYVYPWYQLNQAYKELIYSKETKAEVEAITFRYEAKADGTPIGIGEEYTPPEPKPFTPQPEQRYNMVYNNEDLVVSIWDAEMSKIFELEEAYDVHAHEGCAEIIQYGTEETPDLDENGNVQYNEDGSTKMKTKEYFIMNDGETKIYVKEQPPAPEPIVDKIPEGYKRINEYDLNMIFVVAEDMEDPKTVFNATYEPPVYGEPDAETGEVKLEKEPVWTINEVEGYTHTTVGGYDIVYPVDKEFNPETDINLWDMSMMHPMGPQVEIPDGYRPEGYNTYIYGDDKYLFFPAPETCADFDPADIRFDPVLDEEGNETKERTLVVPDGYTHIVDSNGSTIVVPNGTTEADLTYTQPVVIPEPTEEGTTTE